MVSYMGVKQLVHGSDNSPRSSAQIKCNYTSALHICLHCVHRDDFGHPFPFLKYNPISSHEGFSFLLRIEHVFPFEINFHMVCLQYYLYLRQ